MSALVYHPAYDPYGAILRIIRVSLVISTPVQKGKLRILEFVVLFPEFVSSMSLTPSLRSQWKQAKVSGRFPYEERPPAQRLFAMMEPTFEAAFQTTISKGFLRRVVPGEEWLLDPDATPQNLVALAAARNAAEPALMRLVKALGTELQFEGDKGLKARSGLMEYRYDAV